MVIFHGYVSHNQRVSDLMNLEPENGGSIGWCGEGFLKAFSRSQKFMFVSSLVPKVPMLHDLASNQWEFQDPTDGGTLVPYKAIFWGNISLHRPYIGLMYGRYLQFRFLEWPLIKCISCQPRIHQHLGCWIWGYYLSSGSAQFFVGVHLKIIDQSGFMNCGLTGDAHRYIHTYIHRYIDT